MEYRIVEDLQRSGRKIYRVQFLCPDMPGTAHWIDHVIMGDTPRSLGFLSLKMARRALKRLREREIVDTRVLPD
jgi:hypothetical protein